MSDKDDLFTPDEEFGDLENDDFFMDEVEEPVAKTEDNEEKTEKKVIPKGFSVADWKGLVTMAERKC